MPVLGELKRRKVFQVAAVYAVVAWVLAQIVAPQGGMDRGLMCLVGRELS